MRLSKNIGSAKNFLGAVISLKSQKFIFSTVKDQYCENTFEMCSMPYG